MLPRMRRRWVVLVAAAGLVAGVLGACGDDEAERDDEGAVAEEGDVGVFSLREGDCFDDPDELEGDEAPRVESVAAVPCDQPHDNEVYHLGELPDGDFPGQQEIVQMAFDECLDPFEDFVGVPYEESELEIFPLTPSQDTWEDEDDREVVCAAYLPDEQLTGSVRGSQR
jgi:hypothetical protein